MLTPHLVVKDAKAAIAFYAEAFGAAETYCLIDPIDGRVGHAELKFGETTVSMSDEYPDFGALSPDTIGGSPVSLHLGVPDADAGVARAIAAGAVLLRAVRQEFHGDRTGLVVDPFGYSWYIETRTEDVSPEEMQRRWSNPASASE